MKRRMKRITVLSLMLVMVMSTAIVAFATTKSKSVKKGNYTMNYSLTGTKSTAAGGITDAGDGIDVIAYLGIYSYKNSTVKNSTSVQQIAYIYRALKSNGGNRFVGYHNLKTTSYRPIGESLSLELD